MKTKHIIALSSALLCCGVMTAYAEGVSVEKFTHTNIVGNQTCYSGDDLIEKDITSLPDVVMGMRLNNPVISAYLKADTAKTVTVRAEQYTKYGKLIKTDEASFNVGTTAAKYEFKRVRNAYAVKLYADGEYIGGINDEPVYENGISYSEVPTDYQIYQRGDDNTAVVRVSGVMDDESMAAETGSAGMIEVSENDITINLPEERESAAAVVSEYNEDGSLKSVSLKTVTAQDNIIHSDTSNSGVKVMLWDGITTMEPLCDAVAGITATSDPKVTVTAVNKATGDSTASTADEKSFVAELTLDAGIYDITVKGPKGEKRITDVGVGDIWVAAGQSNMTDMGAVCDGFNPEKDDPINENMHIIHAENTTWQQMSHPAGEGRFWKAPGRTSPVTSFAREIAAAENVPVGIVQSSVGGTNIFQWARGVKPGDAADGYLIGAMESCFDNMPSTDIKGIIWYQGCNDAMTENYAYNYENLQRTIFTQFREFFGEDTPIITTQINDAKQDSTASLGYYDAWSYVKDIQRRNPELYDNVYVVGTGALDLGDTIHNSAKSNLEVGGAWARTALNRVYGHEEVVYEHPTIDTVKVTDEHTIELVFKNVGTDGLYVRNDVKRLGITNGLHTIQLGDLKKEFTVRMGGVKEPVASNTGKGTTLTITDAVLQADGKTVILKVDEELAGTVAVDCCYGKYFVPSLTDKANGWSVLAFYNVIADWSGEAIEVTAPVTYTATDTALISQGAVTVEGFASLPADIPADTASDVYMYLNKYTSANASPLVKFDVMGLDTSSVQSAKLRIYTNEINKDRGGNISVYATGTSWTKDSKYSDYAEISKDNQLIRTYEGVNTSTVFPAGNYSDIDVTDYIASLENPQTIAFTADATQVAVALMSGVNSENPPQLVVQSGKKTEIVYTDAAGTPAAGVTVTISGTGQTEYAAKEFVTDENGKINAVLVEGTYKAITSVGSYLASENRFSISEDVSMTYMLEKNMQIPGSIVISGGADTAASGTATPVFTAVLYDTEGRIIADGAKWTWICDNNSSVENGIVTMGDDLNVDDVVTLTVSAEFNGTTVSAERKITVIGITGYGFGSEYVAVKGFDTGNANNAPVGNSGLKLSSTGGNYNGAFIRNSSSANAGYWPYTSGFKAEEDKYYLFAGAGGSNGSCVMTLTLAQPIKAGKTITIKLAKPKATQKAGTDRSSANNDLTVVIGSATLDLKNNYAFDEWKTEEIVSDTDVSEIKLNLGAWCAVAIESISIDGGEIPTVTPDPGETVEKIKVMPLGDSITNGFTVAGAYRNQLGNLLVQNGLSDYVDFVGSQNTGNSYDNDNEGHSGWAIADIPASGDVEGKGRSGITANIDSWMTTYTPDIVLLQIGTNDILSLYDLDNAPARLEALVDKVVAKLPSDGKLYIAKIPYISETAAYNKTGKSQSELDTIVDTYNAAVAQLAADKGLDIVDINGCLTLSDLKDGIHPTEAGYAKMGTLWYNTLEGEIKARM